MSRKNNLPPIATLVSEDRIIVCDPLTGRVVTIDPHDKNFQSSHVALYGFWRTAYGLKDTSHD